jgi:hypothetical protein
MNEAFYSELYVKSYKLEKERMEKRGKFYVLDEITSGANINLVLTDVFP